MSLKTKISAIIIAPAYIAFAISVFLLLIVFRLTFRLLYFLGVIDALDFWLFNTRKLLVIFEFTRSLSKEDRKAMNSKE